MPDAWCVCWTYPSRERQVWRELADLDLAPYFPILPQRERPRWPGYVFFDADLWTPQTFHHVKALKGVGGILWAGDRPATIPAEQLTSPILDHILGAIRLAFPNDPMFKSRRQIKSELRMKAYLARKFGNG